MHMPSSLTPGQAITLRLHTRTQMTADQQARAGMIQGHYMVEAAGVLYRKATCACGWRGQVERRGNAWAQTSKLRKLERDHLQKVSE